MASRKDGFLNEERARSAAAATRSGALLLSKSIRVAIYSVLAVFEPLVLRGFGFLTLVLLAMAIFFKGLLGLPHFPVVTVLCIATGTALAVPAYYAVMNLLLPD